MPEKKVVVFCSASYDIDPEYNALAREVIHELCALGYAIVSGGTVKGTMGVVAEETARLGGTHIGVLPRFMSQVVYPGLTEVVWTDTMSGRKESMRGGVCAAIALPGGIGTLDELIETLVLAKLDLFKGGVYALNYKDFYRPFIQLLDHYVDTGMLDRRTRELIRFPSDPKELADLLK